MNQLFLKDMEIMKNTETKETSKLEWNELEQFLPTMEIVQGGYSDATRGIVTTEQGRFFVKVGATEATKGWAQKETRVYDFLSQNNFFHIPSVIATNTDKTAFALEALEAYDGWDWSENWSTERLSATLSALDELASIRPPLDNPDVTTPIMSTLSNGWIELLSSDERKEKLAQKLSTRQAGKIIEQIEHFANETSNFSFQKDALIHGDVRGDNCAWNAQTGEVKIVDWNWLELGDRRIDLAAMLVHVHQSGYDVLENNSDRLDTAALYWIAGFWLAAASKPIWVGGNASLRDFQLDSGIAALDLVSKLK
jgi:fructosamine-3-kinase